MMPLRPVFSCHLSEQCVVMGRGGEVLTSYLPQNVSCDISCPGYQQQSGGCQHSPAHCLGQSQLPKLAQTAGRKH